jgi:hypothetical protein
MVKSKTRQHGSEHIILNNNEDELWEINYDNETAINVSGHINMNSVRTDVIKYSGTIEEFLVKERACTNVYHHRNMTSGTKLYDRICTFDG